MEEQKYRHEMKYLITQGQLVMLQQRLNGLIPLDSHAKGGSYRIRSLYFDDYYNRCYYENLSGVDPREKFRIRIYNEDDSRICLECKRKERGKTLKTAAPITKEQFALLCAGKVPEDLEHQKPVVRKMALEMKLHGMHPAVIVEYLRIPYVYQNGNVRITLDTNLTSSPALDQFFEKSIPRRPVMPAGMHLLEVKYDSYLPDFIYRALQLDNLQQTAYSKYYLCRKYTL